MSIADILSALMAYGLLHMRGVAGYAGWRWLFMVEVSIVAHQKILGTLSTTFSPDG